MDFIGRLSRILVRDDSDKLSFVVPTLQVHSQDSADADSGPFTQEVFRKWLVFLVLIATLSLKL